METRFDESFVQQLLAQDDVTTESGYAGRRADLLRRLVRFERRERLIKTAAAVAVLATFTLLGIILCDQVAEFQDWGPPGLFGDAVERPLAIVTTACGLISMPLLVLYFLQQRSAIKARVDARDVALLELREAVAALQRQVSAVGRTEKPSAGE